MNLPCLTQIKQAISVSIRVTNEETEKAARQQLTEISLARKQLESDLRMMNKPYREEIDKNNKACKDWQRQLEEKEQEFEQAILLYRRKLELKVDKFNAGQITKFETKSDKAAAKSIENGTPMPLVIPPALVARPAKTVEIAGAVQTIVKRKAWKLAHNPTARDPEQISASEAQTYGIPLEYFSLDTAKIQKVFRHISIPGIEVYEEESISIKA